MAAVAAVVTVGSTFTALSAPSSAPARAAEAELAPPRELGPPPPALLPAVDPPGSVVAEARLLPGAGERLVPSLAVFGVPSLADPSNGPLVLAGHLSGPISAGPVGPEPGLPSHTVDLGGRSGHVVVDGMVTWVSWYRAGAAAPTRRFVAGRGVSLSTLVSLARHRPELAEPAEWPSDRRPDAVGPGLALLTRTALDTADLVGPGTRLVRYRTPGRAGSEISITVSPDPTLSLALRFLVHDAGGTDVRGITGSAGPVAATAITPRRTARVWVEGASTVAVVAGPAITSAELDALVAGLAPAPGERWAWLRARWPLLPADALLPPVEPVEQVDGPLAELGGGPLAEPGDRTSGHRWAVRLVAVDGRLRVEVGAATADGIVTRPGGADGRVGPPAAWDRGPVTGELAVHRLPTGLVLVAGPAPAGTHRLEVVAGHVPLTVATAPVAPRSGPFFAAVTEVPAGVGTPSGDVRVRGTAFDASGRVLARFSAPLARR